MKHLLSLCLPHMLLSHNIWAYIDALRFYNDFPGSIQRPNVTILAQLDGLIFHHMLSWHDVEDKDRTDKAALASSILTCYNCQRDNFGISVITLTEAGDSSLFPLAVVKVHVKPCKAERWLIMSPAKIPHWGVMIILYVYSVIYILTDQCPEVKKYCYSFTDQSVHALTALDENLHLPATKKCPTSSIKLKPVSLFANTCNRRKDLDHI